MVALATAFVRVRPDPATRATFQAETDAAIGPAAASSGDKAAATFGSRMNAGLAKLTPQLAKWGSVAFAGAVTGALVAGSKLEDSQSQLGRAVTDSGGKVSTYSTAIGVAQKAMEKLGYTNTSTNTALTTLTTATGSTKTALGLMSTAANLAANKHISLTDAATLLAKASSGSAKGLQGLGITMVTGSTQADTMSKAQQLLADQVSTAGGIAKFAADHHLTLAGAQKLVGDAAAGSIPAMNSLGIDVLPKSATAAQRLGELTKIMNQRIGGDAQSAADTTGGKFTILKSRVEDLGAALGVKLMPLVGDLVGFLTGPLGMPTLIGLASLATLSWIGSLGQSLVPFGKFVLAVGKAILAGGEFLAESVIQAGGVLAAWVASMFGVEASMTGVIIASGGILLAVAGIAIGAYELWKHWSTVFAWCKGVVEDVWGWIKDNWPLLLGILTGPIGLAVVEIVKHWTEITDAGKDVITWIRGAWDHAIGWLEQAGEDVINGLWNGIRLVWGREVSFFTTFGPMVYGYFKDALVWLLQGGKNIISGLWNGIKAVWSDVIGWFADIPGAILKALHISSPPDWAISAGKWIMTGITQGAEAHLGGLVNAMSKAAAAAGSALTAGSGVKRWSADVLTALSMLNLPASYLPLVLNQMQSESGGNPNAQNNTDINARMGTPSRGLMQVIGPTFEEWRSATLPDNIWDPMANIYAALNYAKHGRGFGTGPGQIGSMHGYAVGGLITEPIFGVGRSGKHYRFGENGPETVSPGGDGGQHRTYYVGPINVPPNANKADIGRATVDAIIAYETGSGSAWRAGAR